MKLKAILAILRSRKFVLVAVDKRSLKVTGLEAGSKELSVNILASSMLLKMYEETKTKVEEQAAEAGQLRNLEAIRDAVKALEESSDGGQ